MDQPSLFDRPVSISAPFHGRSQASRDASKSGARHAEETRSANIALMRKVWVEPHTMHEIHELTGLPLSSVCSLKSAIEDELEVVDHVTIEWGEGRRATQRTRWKLAK